MVVITIWTRATEAGRRFSEAHNVNTMILPDLITDIVGQSMDPEETAPFSFQYFHYTYRLLYLKQLLSQCTCISVPQFPLYSYIRNLHQANIQPDIMHWNM